MSFLALAGIGLSATRATKLLVQIFNYFLEGFEDTFGFVVGGNDDTDAHFGGLNGTCVGSGKRFGGLKFLLADAALREPAVVPTR